MHAFALYWIAAFVALVVAVFVTVIIYQLMGDGLELNGWVAELVVAGLVSAGQAAGPLLQNAISHSSDTGVAHGTNVRFVAIIFALAFWLGYQLSHLTSWDWLEYLILGLVDSVFAIGAFIFVSRWVAS